MQSEHLKIVNFSNCRLAWNQKLMNWTGRLGYILLLIYSWLPRFFHRFICWLHKFLQTFTPKKIHIWGKFIRPDFTISLSGSPCRFSFLSRPLFFSQSTPLCLQSNGEALEYNGKEVERQRDQKDSIYMNCMNCHSKKL